MATRISAGSGEKMQYIVHMHNDNTIRFVAEYPTVPDPETLAAAAAALAGSVDVLHASFLPGKHGAHWQVHPKTDKNACFRHVVTDGDVLEAAQQHALIPVRPCDPCQMRLTLVEDGKKSAIAFTLSHLCADGRDGYYLLKKLAEAYRMARETGSCCALSVKQGTRSVRQLYRGLSLPERFSLLRDPRSGVRSRFPFPTDAPGAPRMIAREVPSHVMDRARSRAKAEGATVNDLLLAACYRACARTPGGMPFPVSISSMMDLRRYIGAKDSAGLSNLSGLLPTHIDRADASFQEVLSAVASQTAAYKAIPYSGLRGMPLLHFAAWALPLPVLERVSARLYGSMSVGLTNLGELDGAALSFDGIAPQLVQFGGPAKNKPAVQVSAVSLNGALSLSVAGKYADEDVPVLDGFLRTLADELRDYSEQA